MVMTRNNLSGSKRRGQTFACWRDHPFIRSAYQYFCTCAATGRFEAFCAIEQNGTLGMAHNSYSVNQVCNLFVCNDGIVRTGFWGLHLPG